MPIRNCMVELLMSTRSGQPVNKDKIRTSHELSLSLYVPMPRRTFWLESKPSVDSVQSVLVILLYMSDNDERLLIKCFMREL